MKSTKQPTVIIASKAGRLGNRLFQAAHFMGNALTRGYQLFNPSLGEYAPLFEGSARDPLCGFPQGWRDLEPEFADQCREVLFEGAQLLGLAAARGIVPGATAVDIRRFDEMEEGDINLAGEAFGNLLNSGKLLLPMGWKFSDHVGIRQYREAIVRYFTPVESIRKPAEKIISHARKLGDLLVGVHIRQDDYRQWKNGIHFYETKRYVQWMKELSERNPDNKFVFLVCASNHFNELLFHDLSVVKGPGSPAGDLHALSLCDRIMGPPSTFSSWAAYHGQVPLCVLHDIFSKVGEEDFITRLCD
jgi:hypothetical protein